MNRAKLIVLLGAPACGKSSIALKIAKETGICLAAKDDFKIAVFEARGFRSRTEKKLLGKLAENNFFQFIKDKLNAQVDLIVEGCFKELDTLCDILDSSNSTYSEYWIFCHAAPNILAQRYNKRLKSPERHPALSICNYYPFVEGISEFQTPISAEFADIAQSLLVKPDRKNLLTVDTTNLHRDFDFVCRRIINFCNSEGSF